MNNLKKIVRSNSFLFSTYCFYQFLLSLLYRVFWIFPIKRDRIVFQSYNGNYYNDNPKAISDKMMGKAEIIWVIKNASEYNKENVKFVELGSLLSLYYYATAHVWIDNCRKSMYMRKRKNQYYIQMWHGNLALKCVEKYAEDTLEKDYIIRAKNDAKMTDLMITNSKWGVNFYRNCFWYSNDIKVWGTARLDCVINSTEFDKMIIRKKLGVGKEKILLYAPTFRNTNELDCYDIDFNRLKATLEKKTNDKWICLLRLHPNLLNMSEKIVIPGVINVTSYPDIYDLFQICNLVISDYSSNLLEAASLGIPTVGYANDIKHYISTERKMMFDLEDLPYTITQSNDELNSYLFRYNYQDEKKRYQLFFNKLGLVEDGRCSEKICSHVINIMQKN